MYDFAFFFFNDTATTEIYTLSLHDALPICFYDARVEEVRTPEVGPNQVKVEFVVAEGQPVKIVAVKVVGADRSEEHTSELQSRPHLVCRLLLEKKKTRGPDCLLSP